MSETDTQRQGQVFRVLWW